MKYLIVGLGLIGGSYAKGLKEKGHYVYGVTRSLETINYALDMGYIDEGKPIDEDFDEFIDNADIVILASYPEQILGFLDKHNGRFKKGQIITDVAGVKTCYVYEAIKKAKPATYIAHHPMAGRETSGIKYANTEMFKGANFLIVSVKNDKEDIEKIASIGEDLGFKNITVMTPEKHDKMIGFTSQLAHAIAVSLVNADTEEDTKYFIGDSYRDLTRIAKINEELWSSLFLLNKDYLIAEIEGFSSELNKIKTALVDEDAEALKKIFISSRIKRTEMDKVKR